MTENLCFKFKSLVNLFENKKDMKKIYIVTVLMIIIVVTGIKCRAQDDGRSLLRQVIHENQEAVDAIAMYPTETRKIIFQACEYPEVIAKLNAMQKNSQDTFEKLISSFSKEEQEKIWNMTRYDGLFSDLTAKPKMSDDEIDNILVNYPEEIHKTALDERKNNYDLLVQIDKMNKSYNSDFELLLSDYPPEVMNTFREMIKMPEVLDILFDHMQYTVVVGDYYKKNPGRVIHKTDSLNQVLTQKNAQEADDWKQSMNDNPQAREEYTHAAQEYARDNGYQPEDYNAPLTPDVTNYNSYPFNWWFGYPSWYPYDYWNPYPYWYDWGFYFGPGGRIIFFGLPSAYFMEWYFYYPEHCSHYPELSNHYYNYYGRHRGSMNSNSISHSVNDWRDRNKTIITDEWDKDNSNRTRWFKEYGQMEVERKKQNTKPQSIQEYIPEPVKKPAVVVPRNVSIQPKNPANLKQNENFNQVRNAQQYHENTWKQIQPQTQPVRQPQQRNNTPPPVQQEKRQVEQPAKQNIQTPSNKRK